MRPSELSSFLVFAVANKFPVLIKGKPGIGKSDIVSQAAAQSGAELIISHPVVSDPTDYKGLPFPGQDGSAHFMPFGDLNKLIFLDLSKVLKQQTPTCHGDGLAEINLNSYVFTGKSHDRKPYDLAVDRT